MSEERLDKLAKDIQKLPKERANMLKKSMERKAVSIGEAAEMLGCSRDTVRRAIKSEKLKAFRLVDGGHFRIAVEEIDRFIRERNL